MNLYLKMVIQEEFRAWRRFTLTGEDEGLYELKGALRLVNPKSYVRLRSSERVNV